MYIDFTFSLCTRFLHTRWPTGRGFSLTWTGIVPTFHSILFFYLLCRSPPPQAIGSVTVFQDVWYSRLKFRYSGTKIQVLANLSIWIASYFARFQNDAFHGVQHLLIPELRKIAYDSKVRNWPVSKVCSEGLDALISLLFFDAMVIFAEL